MKEARNGLFMFERDYMDYHADRFTDHSLMVYDDTDRLIAVLPANKQDDVLHSHQGLTFGGFLVGNGMKSAMMLEVFTALRVHMSGHGLKKLIYKAIPHIYHRQPAEEELYALFRNDARLFRTDITTSVNMQDRIAFSDLRKRGAKKAAKSGVTVQHSLDFAGYMAVLATTLRDKHGLKPVHSTAEIEMLASRFPDNIKLYTAEQDGVILAGTLMFESARVAHAQYIAASSEGQQVGALDAVFDHLINSVYSEKAWFNFGVSSEQDGRVLNEGLISQKEGFGGRAVMHQFYELDAAA